MATDKLIQSLKVALTSYPHFSGQLFRIPKHDPDYPSPQNLGGRCAVTYNDANAPGVEVMDLEYARPLGPLLPGCVTGATDDNQVGQEIWKMQSELDMLFYPKSAIAFSPVTGINEWKGRVSTVVQIARFVDGYVVITLGIHHAICDATTVCDFMNQWSKVHAAILKNESPAAVKRHLFKYESTALSQSDEQPQDVLNQMFKRGPHPAYDLWASPRPGQEHAFMWYPITVPMDPKLDVNPSPMPRPPIENWKWGPLDRVALHFSAEELANMLGLVKPFLPAGMWVSRLDVLSAFIIRLFSTAKGLTLEDIAKNGFRCQTAFNARTRMKDVDSLCSASLIQFLRVVPEHGDVLENGRDDIRGLGALALAWREAVNTVTQESIDTLNRWYDTQQDIERYFILSFGSFDPILSSWLRMGLYEPNWGPGVGKPVFAAGIFPPVDTVVAFTEPPPSIGGNGVMAYVSLNPEVMNEFLNHPDIRRFR
jgi:hypothetical protein